MQILRVVEAQRSQWADIASQYAAVCNTIRPTISQQQQQQQPPQSAGSSSAGSGASSASASASSTAAAAASLASDQASARALLSTWVSGRVSWFLRQLTSAVAVIDDGANLASLLAQATYAARRAGRLGADYSALLPPIFASRARALFSDRLRAATASFRDDVAAWTWAYKTGHDPNNATTTGSSASASGSASSGGVAASDASSVTPLAPPQSLMRFQPLAELTNGLLLAYTAVRPVLPVDASSWIRLEALTLLESAFTALADAPHAQGSPIAQQLAMAAASRGGGAGHSRGPSAVALSASALRDRRGGGAGALSDDDAAAVQRFLGMVRAAGETFAPYSLLVLQHLSGGASLDTTGFDNPSSTLISLESAIANKGLGDGQSDAAWALARRKADALSGMVAAALQQR